MKPNYFPIQSRDLILWNLVLLLSCRECFCVWFLRLLFFSRLYLLLLLFILISLFASIRSEMSHMLNSIIRKHRKRGRAFNVILPVLPRLQLLDFRTYDDWLRRFNQFIILCYRFADADRGLNFDLAVYQLRNKSLASSMRLSRILPFRTNICSNHIQYRRICIV